MSDTDDEYEGWTNRETWAVNLWLSNDEGMYNEVNEIVDNAEDREEIENGIREYVENLKEFLDSGEACGELRNMFEDIGSMWRVNWEEIAESWKE